MMTAIREDLLIVYSSYMHGVKMNFVHMLFNIKKKTGQYLLRTQSL